MPAPPDGRTRHRGFGAAESGYGLQMSEFWRGIALITVGAILHFAVTVHTQDIDIQTVGTVLLLVGLLDLLISSVFLSHERGWWDSRRAPQVIERDAYGVGASSHPSGSGGADAQQTQQLPIVRGQA